LASKSEEQEGAVFVGEQLRRFYRCGHGTGRLQAEVVGALPRACSAARPPSAGARACASVAGPTHLGQQSAALTLLSQHSVSPSPQIKAVLDPNAQLLDPM